MDKKQESNKLSKIWWWCFQYTATAVLNHQEIKRDSQRISTIMPFINKCNRGRIKYPSKTDDWKTFEKINRTIALNVLCIKVMGMCLTYISKINSD